MEEFAMTFDYPIFTGRGDGFEQIPYPVTGNEDLNNPAIKMERSADVPLPPIVICPSEVEHINITLEKNQQCACKDCGKLFNSVWYLKQHAVKHSNDRPFKCKFCFKTYKFRSNLYQHKCPDRQKSGLTGRRGARGTGVGIPNLPGTPTAVQKRIETNQLLKNKIESHTMNMALSTESMQNTAPINFMPPFQPMHGEVPINAQGGAAFLGYGDDADDGDLSYGLCIRIESAPPVVLETTKPAEQPKRPEDCIRLKPMSVEEVEKYVSSNRTKIHTCRKCKVHFPSEETLERHYAAHRHEEAHCFRCDSCPQMFDCQVELAKHISSHASMGPWSCDGCTGCFRSNVALRRHMDASRTCRYRPFDVPIGIIENASSPLDPSAFIISEADNIPPMEYEIEKKAVEKAESGIGSSPESQQFTSPDRSVATAIDDEYDENLFGKKKEKEDDDADSGFRSRFNSVTQSCSPSSSSVFSSDGGSPHRKNSHDATSNGGISFGISSFGSGTSYGQKLFLHEQPVGGTGTYNAFTNYFTTPSSFTSMMIINQEQVATIGIAKLSPSLVHPKVCFPQIDDVYMLDCLPQLLYSMDGLPPASPPFAIPSSPVISSAKPALPHNVLQSLSLLALLFILSNIHVIRAHGCEDAVVASCENECKLGVEERKAEDEK